MESLLSGQHPFSMRASDSENNFSFLASLGHFV